MADKINILFLCTINQMRSRTAEDIYADDQRFNVKSAGLALDAAVRVNLDMLKWARYVVVMEEKHRHWLERSFPDIYPNLDVFSLDIPDIYYRHSNELISLLRQGVEWLYKVVMVPEKSNEKVLIDPRKQKKILFVCTYNQMRSKTAEALYIKDPRFIVKSAGVSDRAVVPLNLTLMLWPDYIIVMEQMHVQTFKDKYPVIYAKKPVICLDIPDIYNYMDPELVEKIQTNFEIVYEEKIRTVD